jgi:hypothetical protein
MTLRHRISQWELKLASSRKADYSAKVAISGGNKSSLFPTNVHFTWIIFTKVYQVLKR